MNREIDHLLSMIRQARQVYVCGNGGSSATAEHLASDLFTKGVKAFCLNSNTSIMTMIGNDYGYKEVFSRQVKTYANGDDLLIVISASGNSENILEALQTPTFNKSFALLGMGGGKAKDLATDCYIVKSDDYGVIEDEHMKLVHYIKDNL